MTFGPYTSTASKWQATVDVLIASTRLMLFGVNGWSPCPVPQRQLATQEQDLVEEILRITDSERRPRRL